MRSEALHPSEVHVWSWPRRADRACCLDVLGTYLGQGRSAIRVAHTALGKPCLPGSGLEFSVSHSAAWTALAVSASPVGLDIERIVQLPDLDDVAASAFGAAELQVLAGCKPAARQEMFYRCWTRKEALLKAIGCGLTTDPRMADTFRSHGWHFHPLTQVPGCAGSVATAVVNARIVFRGDPDAR